ncbi:MAG TPA: hypothetical protein PLM53_13905 [Spirochaetota bacterium]|nr:hypothetical protein [Spirochaetota bacterium]HPC39609.1 hypothetical protein [Spirochaetota bacterium]HQF09505.1 hypothetical protein [Spirochaetota bacterium]HQH98188.1 hypothetical protein [Spirochaetota bacterium]HQJ72366.1 hypothetical protein [Spirochaetota bacterium]
MKLFEEIIHELRSWMEGMRTSPHGFVESAADHRPWPAGEKGNIVLQCDTAVELGNPRDESASFLVWTGDADLVRDGMITRIGPDAAGSDGARLPLGKAVILHVEGFTEENCYERHREIELARYDVNLKGYMMRAVSQYMREWSRISRQAIADGFSLDVLASALMDRHRRLDYVRGAEILIVTSSPDDVRSLQHVGERAVRLIGAMNKMARELSFDCGTCDFTDVCGEVSELRSMRDTLRGKEKALYERN